MYSYVALHNTDDKIELLEQLSQLEYWEIAIDKKNKILYHKNNIPSLDIKKILPEIKKLKDKGKIDITNYLKKASIDTYWILDKYEISKENLTKFYNCDNIPGICDIKQYSFILEDLKTKEYIWMFPNGYFNKWNGEFRIEYSTIKTNISRLPFYFKNDKLTVFTEEDRKLKLDKTYTVYNYQIDRVFLWATSFSIIYTNEQDKYITIVYNDNTIKHYNITKLLESKWVDMINIQETWYIYGVVPYISIAVDDNSDALDTMWFQNSLFLYVLPEGVKIIENVIDYFLFNNNIYTISLINWQYYLYRDGVFLRNFATYYGHKLLDDYAELYTRNYASDNNKIDVFKLNKNWNIEYLREEDKRQFNLYDLSMKK